jgi:hypothetical protein
MTKRIARDESIALGGHTSLGISAATCDQIGRSECTRGTAHAQQLLYECRTCKIEFHRDWFIADTCHNGHDLPPIPVLFHSSCMYARLGKHTD